MSLSASSLHIIIILDMVWQNLKLVPWVFRKIDLHGQDLDTLWQNLKHGFFHRIGSHDSELTHYGRIWNDSVPWAFWEISLHQWKLSRPVSEISSHKSHLDTEGHGKIFVSESIHNNNLAGPGLNVMTAHYLYVVCDKISLVFIVLFLVAKQFMVGWLLCIFCLDHFHSDYSDWVK